MIDQNKITMFKTGVTTRCSDPSYPKVLYNSIYPSLRYAMDKFRDEKEENRKKKPVQNNKCSFGRINNSDRQNILWYLQNKVKKNLNFQF